MVKTLVIEAADVLPNPDRPAFPQHPETNIEKYDEMSGLTKREQFALAAVSGQCALDVSLSASAIARGAVEIADQTLCALAHSGPGAVAIRWVNLPDCEGTWIRRIIMSRREYCILEVFEFDGVLSANFTGSLFTVKELGGMWCRFVDKDSLGS